MSIELNGTNGITNTGAYTGDGLSIADGAPSGALQIAAAGNAGLGVAPSAWAVGVGKAIEVGSAGNGLYGYSAANFNMSAGAYYDGAWKYAAHSTSVSYYNQSAGKHQWYTAPSGTAGNPITFTQAMTLDAAGRLTTPYQPAFIAVSISSQEPTTLAKINYSDASILNRGNYYNTTTSTFTAPVSGLYSFTVRYWHNPNTTGATYVFFFKNNSVWSEYREIMPVASSEYFAWVRTANIYLYAGDYVDVRAYGGSSQFHSSSTIRYSEFSGYLIG